MYNAVVNNQQHANLLLGNLNIQHIFSDLIDLLDLGKPWGPINQWQPQYKDFELFQGSRWKLQSSVYSENIWEHLSALETCDRCRIIITWSFQKDNKQASWPFHCVGEHVLFLQAATPLYPLCILVNVSCCYLLAVYFEHNGCSH